MAETSDVAIIGGGAVGSSIAYFLASNPDFRGRVTVVERDPTYRFASSALSLSSIRLQFSTPTNIYLSAFGIEFLKGAARHLEVDGEPANVGYIERPYLFLASPEGRAVLEANHRTQTGTGLGANILLLEPAALQERFPWLNTEGLALGSLGVKDEGWFDGYGLLQAFRRKARSLGVTYLAQDVVGIERRGRRIEAIKLGDGTRLACGIAVNAAGPSAGKVAALAGVDLPVEPRRRCVFVFDCREKLPGCPLLIDGSGAFFRPEGQYFIGGISPPPELEPEVPDFEVNYSEWDDLVWPPLAERVPALAAVKVINAWAGHYDYNTFDHNGILGPHVEIDNFMLANGFSGHGIQQSPATGRGISELIAYGEYRSLDLTPLGHARIVENRPVKEINVV
ncbi:MAG TPA: FAD-binding oxidoreductase [Stellaceae bacterium]|nr:FAD-binding oxidoreductase [Stellaceae bacterium]